MRQFLLISLFAILLGDIMLGLGLAFAPGLSLKNAMLYVIFIALVLEFSVGKRDSLPETWTLLITWFLLVCYATFTWLVIVLLGLHRGYSALEGFITLKGQIVDLFLFLLVYMYGPKDVSGAWNLLRWLVFIFVIVNVVTLLDVLNLPDLGILSERSDGRLAGPLNDVNGYGAVLIFIIPITAGLMVGSDGWLKRLFAIGTFVAFILLGLTVSRGSYLGLLVGGSLALYLVRDHIPRKSVIKGSLLIAGVLIVVGGAIAYVNPEGFIAQFEFVGSTLDRVSSGRIYFWRQTMTMMSYQPISFVIGYGWNAYATLFLGYGDPHNTYLMYWFNLGLIGLSLYLFIVVYFIRFAIRRLEAVSSDVKPVVVGFIVGFMSLHVALFFVGLYTPWLFIWAISGAILRLLVEDHRAISTSSDTPEQSREQ